MHPHQKMADDGRAAARHLHDSQAAGRRARGDDPAQRGAELARDIAHTDCAFVLTETAHLDLFHAAGAIGSTGAPIAVARCCGSCPSPPTTTRPECTPIRTAMPPPGVSVRRAGWLVQLQGREHRPPGMILLGHGRAKHRREALRCLMGQRAPIGLEHLVGEVAHRL